MSEQAIKFYSIFPFSIVIPVLVIITAGLIWSEVVHKKKFTTLRILAVTLMMAGVAGIILRPSIRTEETSSVLLLTPGYDTKQVDSLRRVHPSLALYRTFNALHYNNAAVLNSNNDAMSLPGIRYVAGEGLPSYVHDDLADRSFTFLPAPYPAGIIELHMPDKVIADRKHSITGLFNNRHAGTELFLEGQGGKEDSCVLRKTGLQKFTLTFTPKEEGRFLYHLITRLGKEEKRETLPVEVTRKERLNILFIQQYPTFETQYLKTFLGKQHAILLRYKVSRNIFRYEALNHQGSAVAKLTTPVLKTFDLLFMDTDSYAQLTPGEKNTVETAIEDGLGVMILFNDDPLKLKSIRSLLPFEWKISGSDTAQLLLEGKRISLPVWPVAPTKNIATPAIRNKTKILSGVYAMGFGKIGYNLLQETYRLMLEGDSASYSTLWTTLVDKVAREEQHKAVMRIASAFPVYPDEPLQFQVITNGSEPDVLFNEEKIPLSEDVTVDDVWHGKIWLPEGWHRLNMRKDSAEIWYFVSDTSEWKSLRSANNIKGNLSAAFGSDVTKKSNSAIAYNPLSPALFFLIFLISGGFLWLSPKL